ncbi:hypothetical protein HOS13_gp04 [Caulobacter phage Lullwater]|uniref:Transmembrane protein n=1 Tax=Caulobacter phage Lullwater TaxID=2024607 RepID=A0A291LB12_9CAUD|nr:hypothetical protein HOS13_gp04 [Caulobacter phage Lullwater]ATI16311.1 hypothetical protein Lull_004 [Caulobacter phage Lullwater]
MGWLFSLWTNLWYCVDDHIAAFLGIPALGHVPLWVVNLPFIVAVVFYLGVIALSILAALSVNSRLR